MPLIAPIVFTSTLLVLAPTREAGKEKFYFPTVVGTKWVYKEANVETTEVITAVEEKNGSKFVTVARERKNGKLIPDDLIEVSSRGVFRHTRGHILKIGKEPVCLLDLALKPGKRREFDVRGGEQVRSEAGWMVANEPEELEVPAGKFRAIRVDVQLLKISEKAVNPPIAFTCWYALEVGLVKQRSGDNDEKVLVSFKPGKK